MSKAKQHEGYRDHWETPPEFFERLNDVFDFELDLFASDDNALCDAYFTAEGWCGKDVIPDNGWAWANPPYGKGLGWHIEGVCGGYIEDGLRTVMLLPANTDAGWFHDFVLPHAHIVWIQGRLQFLINGERPTYIDKQGKERKSGNTGGNMLAIFGPNLLGTNSIKAIGNDSTVNRRG